VPAWLTYLLLLIVALFLVTLLSRLLYDNVQQFANRLPEYEQKMEPLLDRLGEADAQSIRKMLDESTQNLIRSVLGTAFGAVELGLMVFFYLLFMILNSRKIRRRIQRAFSPERANRLLLIGQKIDESMQQYMKTKTVVSLGMAVVAAVLTWVFGLQNPLLWGFLFFALNYITYVGSIAACLPPIALAFLEFDNLWMAGLLSALIILNRVFWIDYIEIKMSGQSLNIDPLLLLLALAYWGWFWGLVGLVLAVPMLTSLKIVLANLDATRHWAILLSED
jgi:AI-2 transport protein TqsA